MDWQTPPLTEKAHILSLVRALETAYSFTPENTRIETMPLPFYNGLDLVKLTPQTGNGLFYVCLPNEAVALDGSVANIHYLNQHAPLKLDTGNVEDYMRFRLYFGGKAYVADIRTDKNAYDFTATCKIQDTHGTHEATYRISPRGELSELGMVPSNGAALANIPAFKL